MQEQLSILETLIGILYPVSGQILILISILLSVWLILHVEYGERFSVTKALVVIVFIALFSGTGIHLLLFFIGL
ncbi:MAG: hypothetical protein KAR20_20035 [Candidatus Heimdallarchaeota archaeon]|nr:hypothetical protein [Candidatus Heimdallarchaeota archaeon]